MSLLNVFLEQVETLLSPVLDLRKVTE